MRYLVVVLVLAGCALTRNAPPRELRHFTPDVPLATSTEERQACGELTLGRVSAGAHLRYRIVHRTSPVEVELYNTLRWSERPDIYVKRSLQHQLFAREHLVQTTTRSGLVLDVEVLAFEQVGASGRVQLSYLLRGDRDVAAAGVVTVDRPARSDAIDAVVVAIGAATDGAAHEVAARVAPVVRDHGSCTVSAPQ